MVPTDMLQFTAPFKDHVHSVRILRPCNPVGPSDLARTPAEYMVLLQMESQVPVCMCVGVCVVIAAASYVETAAVGVSSSHCPYSLLYAVPGIDDVTAASTTVRQQQYT